MTKLTIVEGADNVGKSTFIRSMLNEDERPYTILQHHSKPEEGEHPLWRYPILLKNQLELAPKQIIWDRGPISAFIYEGYYRKFLSAQFTAEIIEDLIKLVGSSNFEILLLDRDWKEVEPFHIQELAGSTNDPNGATLQNRKEIHAQWRLAADIFSKYITYRKW